MGEPQCFIIVSVLWVFSVCLHEFGHAWTAYKGGDYTVQEKGYLTMNPLKYTHPFYSLLFPLLIVMIGGIGLPGGAVYIERHLLRSRAWETWVSLAGPAMNLILIVLIALGFRAGWIPSDATHLATISMAFLFQLQVSALLLNLIPLPPLDGFQALAPWLDAPLREKMYSAANLWMFILFIALLVTPLGAAFFKVVRAVTEAFGVNPRWASWGYQAFKFWDQ